jgi:hypothetical protein
MRVCDGGNVAWYGVKSAFRVRLFPKGVNAKSAPRTLIEERVILVRADSFDAALAEGEAEARRYVARPRRRQTNAFGERILTAWLGDLDAFQLFDKPADGAEVFSSTRLVPASKPDSAISNALFGPERKMRGEDLARLRFIGGKIGRELKEFLEAPKPRARKTPPTKTGAPKTRGPGAKKKKTRGRVH